MWLMPVTMPRARSALGPASVMGSYSGPSMWRGNSTVHWIQGVLITSSGVGEYDEMEWKTWSPSTLIESNENSSPRMNSSNSRG